MAEMFASPMMTLSRGEITMTPTHLAEGKVGEHYIIKAVDTDDDEMYQFLQSLGCFEGESISLVSVLSETYVIFVKGAKYSIDRELAEAIRV